MTTERGDAFDPTGATEPWASLQARSFFFEPWCTTLELPHPCVIYVTFGAGGSTRHHGLEVDLWEDGSGASVWVPEAGRVFWQATRLRTTPPVYWKPCGPIRPFDATSGAYDS